MSDEAFLHVLLRYASRTFASKPEKTCVAKKSGAYVPQNVITQPLASSAGTGSPETDENKKHDRMSTTATSNYAAKTTPTEDDQGTQAITKISEHSCLASSSSGSSRSKEQLKIPCGIPAFAYTDDVAIFFMHHLFFRGPRPTGQTTDYDRLAVGAIVFNRDDDKVLLVQRAGKDPLAGKWEIPGGVCASRDMTILHGLVQEVYEGTGLVANEIVATTGYHELMAQSDQWCRKYAFVVKVDTWAVSLDLKKYSRCVWASKQDIAEGRYEDHVLEFPGLEERHHIVRAFRVKERKESPEMEALSSKAHELVGM